MTRSMVAALIVSVVAIVVERTIGNLGPLLSRYSPDVVLFFFNVLPGYHINSLASWIMEGVAEEVSFPSGAVVAASVWTSISVIAAWVIGLVGLTFWRFGRQDIN